MEWKVGDGSLVKFWKDKAIKAFNRALIIKWKWLMFHQPDQLWSRILISKYKGWRGLEEGSHKQTHSFWWSDMKSIMHHSSMAEVLKQFHWKLGSGDQILFWEDSGLGDGITLREKYPELYQISSQKFQLAGSKGSFGEEGWQWEFSWRINLFDNELGSASDFIEQVTALSPNAALKDYWVWGADPKRIFTTSIAYLCIKGLGSGVKWSTIIKLTMANNIDILCIQETKKESVDAKLCQYLWGDSNASWECFPSSNTAGGLLCIWNNGSFLVDRRVLGRGFIMLEGTWLKKDKRVFIINVYAPCELQRKREQWDELLQLRSSYQAGLDFNSIRHREERLNSSQTRDTPPSISELNSWISDMTLEEVRSVGRRFTWCRPNGSVMSKLDRFLLSYEWLSQWPDSTQFVLERDFSDHCPILLKARTID
ncbi:hypothetical protein GmHk_07G019724 [Glycine max]|nr:hypothetical protein GmHk_07G019724 [Glycine max]